jgi:endonuclease YncB( thermonuclease family)
MLRTPGAALLCACALLLTTAAPAAATDWHSGISSATPSLSGGETVRERGYVARVTDGDTFRFAQTPKRKTKDYTVVRLLGLQAPEVSRHRMAGGQCGGDAAQAALTAVAEGKEVVLASETDTRRRGRILRTAHVRNADGSWTDLTAYMLDRGLGQWFPKKRETAHNLQYRQLMEAAVVRRQHMWDPAFCGTRYEAGKPVRIWVQSDPSGNDKRNINGEYVAIHNPGTSTLNISGWTVRDGALNWFRLPPGTTVSPGRTFTVHVGSGANTADAAYWGWRRPIFTNATRDGADYMGDGAYLLDPQGNVRAMFTYPCVECSDPRTAALTFSKVRYDPPGDEVPRPNREFVRLTNQTDQAVSLLAAEIRIGGLTYEFGRKDVVPPGGSLTMRMGERPAVGPGRSKRNRTPDKRRWFGARHAILDNDGDLVRVRTFDGVTIACAGWKALADACG